MSPDTQERFAVQHFIDAIKDQDDRLRLRRDKPKTMDEALTLACELEAFRLLDGDWRGSSSKVRSVDEVGREPDLIRAQLDMLRSDIQMQQQRQETQQVALQQLVQQIQQLSQTMTLNTAGSIVKNQVSINGEVFDCSDFKNQPLSSRCMVRRSTIIEPHTEVVVPVTVHKRSATLDPKASQLGMRLLEPCLSSHLQQKGLYVARTLVNVREDRVVPLRVFNVSEVYNLAAETVVAIATPVMDVTLLELTEENRETVVSQARVVNNHESQETFEKNFTRALTGTSWKEY